MGKIYILCPAYVITGGIELLHQLCYKLCLLGYDAYIQYVGVEEGRSPHIKVYEKYNIRTVDTIIDEPQNVIVFPEIYISSAIIKTQSKRILWWMSVDNASANSKEDFLAAYNDENLLHLSQSEYSTKHLLSNGVNPKNIMWLSDYINSEYLHLSEVPDEEKDDVILFNPKKGFDVTSKIIGSSTGHVKWIALSNLYPDKMRDIMQHSKVYIDFGNHPGRDRIPREASVCGCLVISNLRGAAANNVDILIDDKYKFDNDSNPKEIFDVIADLAKNYSSHKSEYYEYVQRTRNEFKTFETDVLNVFERVMGKCIDEGTAEELKQKALDYIYAGQYNEAYRCIIKYRQLQLDEDLEYTILEATVRTEIGELYEAEYEIKECLKSNEANYELILMLARLHSKLKDRDSLLAGVYECQKACELSKNTPDEEIVFAETKEIINNIKNTLKDF